MTDLNLIPRSVCAPEGCDCGGVTSHRVNFNGQTSCALLDLEPEEIQALIDAAEARTIAYVNAINRASD